MPENIAPLINDGASDISTGLASFLTDALQNEDLSAPRGFLIYITFDEDMNVISDHSDILPVSSPNQLEFLQSEQLVMPENGYFYTYLTNTSDQLVSFDNLTVHHKQGRVRALYDYYPYGLMWSNVRDDQYDNTFEGSEFAHGEWGISGLNMNYFEARWYDPALGRWHSPDPLEQFHSAYVGMANDPANFIDPDGRNAREWIKSHSYEIECLVGTLAVTAIGAGWLTLGSVVPSVLGTATSGIAMVKTAKDVIDHKKQASHYSDDPDGNGLEHCGVGMSYHGLGENLGSKEDFQSSSEGTPTEKGPGPGYNFFKLWECKTGYMLQFDYNKSFETTEVALSPLYPFTSTLSNELPTLYILRFGFSAYYFKSRGELTMAWRHLDKAKLRDENIIVCPTCTEENDFYAYLGTLALTREYWENFGNFVGAASGALGGVVLGLRFAAARRVPNGLSKNISTQKQARHIAGTAKPGGGFLDSVDDAQEVLDAVHSGRATFLGTTKSGHLVYRFEGVTGTNVNFGTNIISQPTNVFLIKGTTNPSVVPTNPFWTH